MIRVTKLILALVLCAIVVLVAYVETAHAQGSRKDDIVFNAQGRPLAGSGVRVCTSAATGQPCTPLASIYSDPGLTQALANPTSTDGMGNYNFYAAPGKYMIEISGPGITTKQIPNVILPSDPSTPTFTSVTTTSGISAFSLSLSGNLTVNGSTSVTGALTVGGLPVPTANQDNQWTAGQRFKGPIPWRDITGYMPAGGCSSSIAQTDPPTTGTISSGSATLTLANARDFKNGCGIAVLNAGPTSTISAPNQACSISAISRVSNVVTVTCAAGHSIFPGAWDHGGIQITGVTDSSFNGTFDVTGVADATHFTYNQIAANASSSSGTATMQWGYAHGATGATTYHYKVSAVDINGGMSPVSPIITITNGNATLSTTNYNWITYGVITSLDPRNRPDLVPHSWVIYSDKGLGGAYSCVGTSFTNAYTDMGLAMPCPAYAPATPPVAATPQVLNTTISAGGGTATLTLAATASNNATAQNVYHDESSFLNACITDDQNDRFSAGFPHGPGSYGCYVPAGNYYFNGPLSTDLGGPVANVGGDLWFAGTPFFNIYPWYFSTPGWYVKGFGGSAVYNSFNHAATTTMQSASSLAASVVMRSANNVEFSGFSIASSGHGIVVENGPYLAAPGSFRFDNDQIATGVGSPLVLDTNVIGVWANNSVFVSQAAAGLGSIWITGLPWNGASNCCMYFNNISTKNHGVRVDQPGGGVGENGIYFTNWIHEALPASDFGLIVHDTGPNAPGVNSTSQLNNVSLANVNNADPVSGPSAVGVFQELGTAVGIAQVNLQEVNSFGGLLLCTAAQAAVCTNSVISTSANSSSALGGTWGGQFQSTPSGIHAEVPIYSKLGLSSYGANPPLPVWAQVLPPLTQFTITGTGAGSLAAAAYCMAVEGKDAQATPGLTLPTPTLCQAVGASASINLQWQQAAGNLNAAYSGFRFVFCSTGGSSCTPNTYLDLAAGGNPYSYTFTSTAGGTGTTLNTVSSAYLSWLMWDRGTKSCLFCTSAAGSNFWQLGVGDPSPPTGAKFSVAGGSINAPSYTTTTNCAANSASPAACGSAASGVFAVPSTTTSYTVNTTAVTAHSRIFMRSILDNTDIPSSPTCVSPLLGSGEYAPTSRVAGTSFTFSMTSTTGTTCFQYWIVN